MPSRTNAEIGREIEDALGWLSHQERELSEVYKLMGTARNGGKVPLDVLDNAISAVQAHHHAAADQLKRIRGKLK